MVAYLASSYNLSVVYRFVPPRADGTSVLALAGAGGYDGLPYVSLPAVPPDSLGASGGDHFGGECAI